MHDKKLVILGLGAAGAYLIVKRAAGNPKSPLNKVASALGIKPGAAGGGGGGFVTRPAAASQSPSTTNLATRNGTATRPASPGIVQEAGVLAGGIGGLITSLSRLFGGNKSTAGTAARPGPTAAPGTPARTSSPSMGGSSGGAAGGPGSTGRQPSPQGSAQGGRADVPFYGPTLDQLMAGRDDLFYGPTADQAGLVMDAQSGYYFNPDDYSNTPSSGSYVPDAGSASDPSSPNYDESQDPNSVYYTGGGTPDTASPYVTDPGPDYGNPADPNSGNSGSYDPTLDNGGYGQEWGGAGGYDGSGYGNDPNSGSYMPDAGSASDPGSANYDASQDPNSVYYDGGTDYGDPGTGDHYL